MENQGWIKIHRSILTWEWIDDPNTFCLWLHLLLKANYKDSVWHGVEVKRGSMIAGREELSKITGISTQSIRTSLNKLKSTSNITIKSTNKYSVISIKNYDQYQDNNQQDNQQLTSNQPATNHVLRSKEDKNIVLPKGNTAVAKPVYGSAPVNHILEAFKSLYGFPPTDRQPRNEAWNLVRAIRKFGKENGRPLNSEVEIKIVDKFFRWIEHQDWSDGIQGLGTIRRKFPIWRSLLEEQLKEGRSHVPQEN